MRRVWQCSSIIFFSFLFFFIPVIDAEAVSLFEGRRIYLSNAENRVFRIGITGTTAGYKYLALIEDARQESISLGDLGYWERIDDPPSFLRNYDLRFTVKNTYKGKFQIEFEYNEKDHDLDYRIKEGRIEVELDKSSYYPTLIIAAIKQDISKGEKDVIEKGVNNLLFFDFNSFDVDLRKHYGGIKKLITEADAKHYFFYYESGDYNSYYFRTYDDVSKLDTDKMGLSLEDGSLEYYQKILDNLKTRFGTEFADRLIIVSRFGSKFSRELKSYAREIGFSDNMVVTFWAYDDIQ